MKTTGNTILITGAGTGMGLEAATELSRRGNAVIMVARNEERLRAEAAHLDQASAFACDVSSSPDVTELLDYLRNRQPARVSRTADR